MAITAKELAKSLNISEAAVSMALNNKPGVSTTTRKKVIEAARYKGYDFAKIKENGRGELKGTICFAIHKKSGAVVTDTPFFSFLTEGISNGCKKGGYDSSIRYLYDGEDFEEQVNLLKTSGYTGVILLATEMNIQSLSYFNNFPLPLLLLDAYFDIPQYNFVLINNIQGAFLATDYLIEKRRTQPGYLRSSYPISNFEERADGFYKAIRKHGMSTSKSIVHNLPPSQDGAYEDMKALINSGEETATCYFADNDHIAVGAMTAFLEAGYRIPEDISIVGFDNLPICKHITPHLTTIDVPKQFMGETAARRMIQIIEESDSLPIKIEINTSLKKRKSVLLSNI